MISELYMNQEAVVRIAGGESDLGIIGRGVRQGCPLSPLLCSIYAKMMMKEALENVEEGIRLGGELIKDVKYADDLGCQWLPIRKQDYRASWTAYIQQRSIMI